ncbi:WD40 repeat domain-containing protein [Bremerella cremea]|uniref:WD40 repeat domain-containing protein n=1 Tax=Bremerella cremea TaxID=1031537 RepID=UPI0031E9E09D
MNTTHLIAASLIVALFHGTWCAAAEPPTYEHDIQPLMRKYCVGCHNDAEPEGDLSLQTYASLQASTSDGPLTKAADPKASRLLAVLQGTAEPKMPPEDEPAPSAEEIALIAKWIEAGIPRGEKSATMGLDVAPIASHNDVRPILALAFSPDGKQLAVGRYGQVQLFAVDDHGEFDLNSPVLELSDVPGKVTAIHFRADGKRLAIASGITGLTGIASIYSIEDGSKLRSLEGHRDMLYDAEYSPDGKWLATCGYDRNIVLWDAESGAKLHELTGHNGAVYDVGFSPDSKFLVSGSADDTCKVWRVADAVRLDTLPQPLKEVYCCAFTPDGKSIVAGGADNNLRVWQFVATDGPKINPMIQARFAHEGALQRLQFSGDGQHLWTIGNDLTVKLWRTRDYTELKAWNDQPEFAMANAALSSQRSLYLGRMDGQIDRLTWSPEDLASKSQAVQSIKPLPIAESTTHDVQEAEGNDQPDTAQAVAFPAKITGTIHNEAAGPDIDFYRFTAKGGQTWVLETNAARMKSPLDSHISICHLDGSPVERLKLQAVRDSYFTFRGKDDSISDDFRIFNWEEMNLNQYLYCSGEVVRLWLHPRGPDSGFRVYPGEGKRWGYFDTTPLAHALGEPCYVVEPIAPGETVVPNGLPVFTLYYENDDESRRTMGDDSRLFFTVPVDGDYLVKVRDVRGFEGANFRYELLARAAKPDFQVNLQTKNLNIASGGAREFIVKCNRVDQFDGEISVTIDGLPSGFQATSPFTIEPGQIEAIGLVQATGEANTLTEDQLKQIKVTATATIDGQPISHDVGGFKKIEIRDKSNLTIRMEATDGGATPLSSEAGKPLEFAIHPGETIMLKVIAERADAKGHVNFGNVGAGRNLPFAVNVANLGLNGLMIMEGSTERDIFITAHEAAEPTSRLFHLQTGTDGGHATGPVLLHVLPKP